MTELRVPTIATVAQVTCADGRVFTGRVFVPAAAFRHTGPMRPEEWINEAALFFPFLPDREDLPVLLNKDEVVAISISAPGPEEEVTGDVTLRAGKRQHLVNKRRITRVLETRP